MAPSTEASHTKQLVLTVGGAGGGVDGGGGGGGGGMVGESAGSAEI